MKDKIHVSVGAKFVTVAEKAKEIATQKDVTVAFDFNGIECLVNASTNLDSLFHDYTNLWRMQANTVYSNCVEKK